MSEEAGPSTITTPVGAEEIEQKLADTKLEESGKSTDPKLRYKKPYWWAYKTFVKQRYIFRENDASCG
jgi:hypothetical protein